MIQSISPPPLPLYKILYILSEFTAFILTDLILSLLLVIKCLYYPKSIKLLTLWNYYPFIASSTFFNEYYCTKFICSLPTNRRLFTDSNSDNPYIQFFPFISIFRFRFSCIRYCIAGKKLHRCYINKKRIHQCY